MNNLVNGYSRDSFTERALLLLEKDIVYLARNNWGYGMEKEDVAQELRLHLWNKLHNYDPRKKGLRTWAQQVMRNKLIDMSRKKKEILDSPKREEYPDLGERELSEEWVLEEVLITIFHW
jgi:RNA polymerase sigma factor (sigma-70 family)